MDPKVTRRDTLRLATAVSALGVGLGVSMDAKGATPTTVSLKRGEVNNLSVSFFKWDAATGYTLLSKTDATALAKGDLSTASIKTTWIKGGASDEVTITELKVQLT